MYNWRKIFFKLLTLNMKFGYDPAIMSLFGGNQTPGGPINPVVIASAASITITSSISFVSGTVGTTTIKMYTGFRGVFVIIPTAAWPPTTGGVYAASDGTYETLPIKVAKTGAANVPMYAVNDGSFIYFTLSA